MFQAQRVEQVGAGQLAGALVAGSVRSVPRPGEMVGAAGAAQGLLLMVVGDALGSHSILALGGLMLAVGAALPVASKAVREVRLD